MGDEKRMTSRSRKYGCLKDLNSDFVLNTMSDGKDNSKKHRTTQEGRTVEVLVGDPSIICWVVL